MKLDLSRLVNLKRHNDGSIQCQCPICAEEGRDKSGRDHLRIFPTGAFNCIVDQSRQHNAQIRRYLRADQTEESDIEYFDPEPKVTVEKVYPEESLSRLVKDYSYWVGRGVKESVLGKLEGGISPEDERGKLSGRFIFPIRGPDGRIVGFTGRLITDNFYLPKWKHVFKVSRVVWPWHIAGPRVKETGTVIFVESIGDMLALFNHDIWNVICIFGLNINGRLISTLVASNVHKIIISLNRDEDPSKGQYAAEKIKNKLCAFFREDNIIIRLPPEGTKDWGAAQDVDIEVFAKEINP